jgi:hypothetical protein
MPGSVQSERWQCSRNAVNNDETGLDRYREKWRETPGGGDMDGRVFSTDLLALDDAAFLAEWDQRAAGRYGGEVGWFGPLYVDTFRGRKVLELGPGLGFDGIRFVANGAHWTFADIVPDNLAVIRRVARLKGLEDRAHFHLIGDDLSFAALPSDYDAIWVCGSIHHVPFDIARREALEVLSHLKPGGRWLELVYPRERWLREGALPFEEWGKGPDGARTPWVEWYDVEKVRRRLFPAPMRTVLDFEFCSKTFRWLDLQYTADKPFRLGDHDPALPARPVDLMQETPVFAHRRRWPFPARPRSFVCPPTIFHWVIYFDLAGPLARLGRTTDVAVDVELVVTRGRIGVGLLDASDNYLPAAEVVVDRDDHSHLVTVRAVGTSRPVKLQFRNLQEGCRSAFELRSATLRAAI